MTMNAEYQAAASRITATRRAPTTEEAYRRRAEEAAVAQRERAAKAYAAENRRLHEEHIARVDAQHEAERQAAETQRMAAARARHAGAFFRAHPTATEQDFERALPHLIEEEQQDRAEQEKRAMLSSPMYARF